MTDSNDRRNRANQTWPLAQLLEDLAQKESGLGFVYAALDLLAKRYGLKDVVVILEMCIRDSCIPLEGEWRHAVHSLSSV